jgi:hypothetical protein
MTKETPNALDHSAALDFDLGTFEGFNFRSQSAINKILTAEEVVNWDHDRDGEAEFWPSGDQPFVAVILKSKTAVTASEILDLNRLLSELGSDSAENYLRIHYGLNTYGAQLESLTVTQIEDYPLHIFFGTSFLDLRREAACELFELYYPEEYKVWRKSTCDGLDFDTDRFLDSPSFSVEEISLPDQVALIVAPQ